MALHPMDWPCPRLGPSLNVALQVGFLGSSPRAVDPNAKVLPSALGRDLSGRYYFKWTLKVKLYLLDVKCGLSLLKDAWCELGRSYARKILRAMRKFIKIFSFNDLTSVNLS